MAEDHDDGIELFGKWFWVSAGVLALGCVALVVLWYARHPGRNIFEDFARRGQVEGPGQNGHVPHAESAMGEDLASAPEATG